MKLDHYRKAFGGAALDTLDRQAEAIGAVIVRVDELGRHLADDRSKARSSQAAADQTELMMQRWMVDAVEQADAVEREHDEALETLRVAFGRPVEVIGRGFWGRLRWLVWGR